MRWVRRDPGAPTGVHAVAGSRRATVSWTAPRSNGSPITGYIVYRYGNGKLIASTTFNSTATTQTITGLKPGDAKTFRVAAINAIGTGPKSSASNVVTPTA